MTRRAAILLGLSSAYAPAQEQKIDFFDIRNGRLFVRIGGEDRVLSTAAVRAWQGWTPYTLLYTEQVNGKQQLRWYESFTRNSKTITSEDADIADLTTARLSTGDYAILIALRSQPDNMPSVALATTAGVFYREDHATYGTAANDMVEIRRYDIGELEHVKANLTLVQPAAIVMVPLTASVVNAAGVYEITLPAADAASRHMMLNLRPDGSATLVTVFTGKDAPTARRGTWKQDGIVVSVQLDHPSETLTWNATIDGLSPRSWDRQLYGSAGLPFRRPQAPKQGPRRAPGTVAPRQ